MDEEEIKKIRKNESENIKLWRKEEKINPANTKKTKERK